MHVILVPQKSQGVGALGALAPLSPGVGVGTFAPDVGAFFGDL